MKFLSTRRAPSLGEVLYSDFLDDVLRRRESDARSKEQAESLQADAIEDLKRLAVEQAVSIVRLERPALHATKSLHDAHFRSDVRKKATSLLFQAHLHVSSS
jgi:hypothetical protein